MTAIVSDMGGETTRERQAQRERQNKKKKTKALAYIVHAYAQEQIDIRPCQLCSCIAPIKSFFSH